jgi:hypothetical protein
MVQRPRPALIATALALAVSGNGTPVFAQQDEDGVPADINRTEASQIEMPALSSDAGPGRAYLDTTGRPAQPPPPRSSLMQTGNDQFSRGASNAPASQISARGQGGSGMTQLSKADLEATLAQLTPAERRVLLQAIEGTDICDNPPQVAAIVALCQTRLETRSSEFAARAEGPVSAEDRLLRGDLESSVLPSVEQVIDRLARGGASSGDFSNQAIASIALGSSAPAPSRPREEEQPDTGSLGEEAQALINALINQLGGRAP